MRCRYVSLCIRPKKKYVCLPSATDRKMPKNLGRDFRFFFSSKTLIMKTHHFRRKMYNLAVKSFTFSSMKCVSLLNKWPWSFIKVFWSSGRPLLCFSRFWPSENVARIRRVYFAYSRTKSVHTRNIASTAKGKCVFCFDCAKWSHYFIHRWALAARTKFHDVSTNEKRKI